MERDDSEVLSIQGLGDMVWVLVALSLLTVSIVYSCIGYRKKTHRESRFTSFAESLCIHGADILNNSVACANNVAGPLKHTRAWWLLGVAILIQFWCAGLKSNLLVDDSLVIDSLEDLMSNPKIICYFPPRSRLIKLLKGKDSKYANLRPQLRRLSRKIAWQLNKEVNENFASGKAVVIDEDTFGAPPQLLNQLKQINRKLYVGKTKYEQFYGHMFFNKRLPRDIKERIDYVAMRITETRQLEPRDREGVFFMREYVFLATLISFTPMKLVYLTVVFHLWIIGLSLGIVTFCFEFLGNERSRKMFC